MIRCGVEIVEFEEPDLSAEVPHCVEAVAGMVLSGVRLKSVPNFEDVVTGCTRLLQFKDAKRARLRRVLRFFFLSRPVRVRFAGGELMTPGQWLARWNGDDAFRRAVMADDRYREFRDRLALNFKSSQRLVLAAEDVRETRALIRGRIDKAAAAAMHGYMEEGGI